MDSSIREIDVFNSNVKAFYTTREGGFSKAPFKSFNLGLHVNDNKDSVLLNRDLLKKNLNNRDIVYMDQIHSSNFTYIDSYIECVLQTDALVTDKKDLVLAVMTADCLPLLLAADNFVAAIHCGWRGVHKGIIKNVMHFLKSKSVDPKTVKAYMGPCIGPQSFEVGEDVKESFLSLDKEYIKAFVKKDIEHKYLCDLAYLCKQELLKEGVIDIYISNLDTFSDKDNFFSYRRDKETGRMASLIYLS